MHVEILLIKAKGRVVSLFSRKLEGLNLSVLSLVFHAPHFIHDEFVKTCFLPNKCVFSGVKKNHCL